VEKRTGADEWRGLGEEQLTNTLGNVTYFGKEMGGNERLGSGIKMPGSNERDESGYFQ
jgi:hypothetical protein